MAPPAARRLAGPQALFLRVRTLLRTNQAAQAAQLATADLARHTRSGSTHDGWLWRTAGLFRSYDQPHLALRLFARLQRRLPAPTHARVAALQAASQLVWNDPRPEPQRPPDPGHHAQHAHLAHSLLELASHHLRGASTPRTTAPTPNTRVLEVVLANILKLGDMDWIVSILRDFYPRYTHQLGLHLYPPSSSGSETLPSEGPLAPDELPSGRLVKFLVTGYMACKDLRRAYGVVCFHRRAVEQAGASEAREVTAEVTFLRGVSRTMQGGLARRMGMVAGVLESLGRRGGVELDSYALDGLLEMRYRMRAGWGFRRPQQCLLLARDYAAVWVLLARPTVLLADLRVCFAADTDAVHRSLQWPAELAAVARWIAAETQSLDPPFVRAAALSHFSLEFLRKAAAVAQLDLIAYGIAPPDAGHSLDQ
ncbi:hypothetical protein PtB15_14B400 [Puccinia triticina]|nr:hypothetical protein PtB15_14B400 [Puccinia triticina]